MTTLRYKLFEHLIRLSGTGRALAKGLARGENVSEPPPRKLRGRWVRAEFDGRDVWTCAPRTADTGRVYVHQHGGGFILGLNGLHYAMWADVADRAGVTVVLPDYPLPPAQTVDGIVAWANAHHASLQAVHGPDQVSLGGDSAGATLALAMSLQGATSAQPLLMLSPWVDAVDEDLPAGAGDKDALLEIDTLRRAGQRYAGERAVDDPLVSPINADPNDLPRLRIFTGELDLLHSQIMRFAAKTKAAGQLDRLRVYGEFAHYWMFYPVPDRESTLVEIAALLRG